MWVETVECIHLKRIKTLSEHLHEYKSQHIIGPSPNHVILQLLFTHISPTLHYPFKQKNKTNQQYLKLNP